MAKRCKICHMPIEDWRNDGDVHPDCRIGKEMDKKKEEILKGFELIQNEVIYSDSIGELRGWEQPNNAIVLFAGDQNTEHVEDYPQTLQFPKAAIPRLIAFLGRVDVPCSEAVRLFSVAWDSQMGKHAEKYADYLEHLVSCKECIATFRLRKEDIARIEEDVVGYRKGAEEMDSFRTQRKKEIELEKEGHSSPK